ncbi:uncharacterized protein BDZ99DRAFT_457865 [Mytilinidion resinicola]|uniref:Uncharacterized protein n=1 Tax=Mytilinidion resinicola TaxID=574789 RepID=A0A6A6Z6K5_9PEZI|nr:uncharacterized protein BDZ99DRAFT_457865 [Mytilinidion resinicola]KAF2815924.1 hypothetical protein BDZ99DRAFT_457865 [Mytilinidion resinicola]
MSDFTNTDPLSLAKQAEADLNSRSAKTGHGTSDTTVESGIDDTATSKFPGSTVTYGSAASGAGDNREIPISEGGGLDPKTGRAYKARDFEGEGGPEDKATKYAEENPGNDDVDNVRR